MGCIGRLPAWSVAWQRLGSSRRQSTEWHVRYSEELILRDGRVHHLAYQQAWVLTDTLRIRHEQQRRLCLPLFRESSQLVTQLARNSNNKLGVNTNSINAEIMHSCYGKKVFAFAPGEEPDNT